MKRLIWKIWIPSACCLLISFLLWTFYIYGTFDYYLRERQIKEVTNLLTFISPELQGLMNKEGDAVQHYCQTIKTQLGEGRITIILPDGKVIGDSDVRDYRQIEDHGNREEVQSALQHKTEIFIRRSRTLGMDMLYFAKVLEVNGKTIGILRYSTPFKNLRDEHAAFEKSIIYAACLFIVMTLIFSLWLTRRVISPVKYLQKIAGQFAVGDFSEKIVSSDIAEIKSVVDSMNSMASHLKTHLSEMRYQKNRLEAVLSGIQEGVIALNDDNEIVMMNQAAADFFKIEIERGIGKKIIYVLQFPNLYKFCREVLQTKKAQRTEEVWKHANSEYLFRIQGAPMFHRSGEVMGLVLVFEDITRMRQLEETRKDFVSNVSHELRTPLTAILGYIETLQGGALADQEDGPRFLEIIEKQTRRMNSLISDLLELSRLEVMEERGEGAQNAIITSLDAIIDNIKTLTRNNLTKNNQRLHINLKPDLSLLMNDSLIEQALLNLVGNAMNYSPVGTDICLNIRGEGEWIVFDVIDQGPGIPEELQTRIFERFYRVDKGRSRAAGGTGIGLSIVKHVVQLHHGCVAVTNRDVGCCFTMKIPKDFTTLSAENQAMQGQQN